MPDTLGLVTGSMVQNEHRTKLSQVDGAAHVQINIIERCVEGCL
jgi:hypothetical protein